MTSDEASEESEFLSALNASLQSFVHKDEKIECIHRIACHGRDVLAVLPAGLGKSAIYVLVIVITKAAPAFFYFCSLKTIILNVIV